MTPTATLRLPAIEMTGCGASISSEPPPLSVWISFSRMPTEFPTGFLPVVSNVQYYSADFLAPATTNGWFISEWFPAERSLSPERALAELRSKTELTWGQLARALGVNRRSLHFWAQGERPSASNLERLMQVVEIVRDIDYGDPAETTALLLEPGDAGPSMFARLCAERIGALPESTGPPHTPGVVSGRVRRPPQLSQEERARREGLAPWERIASLPDRLEREDRQLTSSDEDPPRSA